MFTPELSQYNKQNPSEYRPKIYRTFYRSMNRWYWRVSEMPKRLRRFEVMCHNWKDAHNYVNDLNTRAHAVVSMTFHAPKKVTCITRDGNIFINYSTYEQFVVSANLNGLFSVGVGSYSVDGKPIPQFERWELPK